jgi:hypothetical protein
MEYSPAYIMAQYLIDEGLLISPGDSGDWPVFVGSLPDGDDAADEVVMSMDTSPVKDGRIFENGENIFHYGFQLLIRATAYNTGYAKAQALADNLESIRRNTLVISSTTYRIDNVTQATGIIVLGQEDGSKRRELFSLNFLVTLKEI